MKTLIGIDIQPDFITGALANKDAEAIIPDIVEFIKNWQGPVVFTRDTHVDGIYENSLEDVYSMDQDNLLKRIYVIDGFESSKKLTIIHMNLSVAKKDKDDKNNKGDKGEKIDFSNLQPKIRCSLSKIKWLTLGVDFEFDGNKIVFKNL